MQHASHLERQRLPTKKHIQSEQLEDTVQKKKEEKNLQYLCNDLC